MKRCKICYMPNTRPNTLFKDGICQACINFKDIKKINWIERNKLLKNIIDKQLKTNKNKTSYDCIIPVSGGKNSHVQVKIIKEELKLNPLLVTVCDPFGKTKAGIHNINNLGDTFNCDHIRYHMSPDVFKRATRLCFETTGEPLLFIEVAIYTYPYILAKQLGIPLVFFGESEFELGSWNETPYVNDFIKRKAEYIIIKWWHDNGFTDDELYPVLIDNNNMPPVVLYLGYFYDWGSDLHYRIASRYGFKDLTHEWNREGYLENFEQIDSKGYLVHLWLKYPKFGFQRVSDIVGKRIRYGKLNYDEGKKIVDENDWKLDRVTLDDFCETLGYSIREFWDIVEKFWNKNIFYKDEYGIWRLK